ncbi:MAG: hypothetical protein GY765_18155 [bacterium]|nr:hypothetical protein [bacterium]
MFPKDSFIPGLLNEGEHFYKAMSGYFPNMGAFRHGLDKISRLRDTFNYSSTPASAKKKPAGSVKRKKNRW